MDRDAAYVNADDRILDVGCGIGSLEERFPDHDMIGMDQLGGDDPDSPGASYSDRMCSAMRTQLPIETA